MKSKIYFSQYKVGGLSVAYRRIHKDIKYLFIILSKYTVQYYEEILSLSRMCRVNIFCEQVVLFTYFPLTG